MRLEKSEQILRLALLFGASRAGLTLQGIQGEFSVSRRTAERMRDAVERIFPQLEQVNPGETPKRWRLPRIVCRELAGISPEDLLALEAAKKALKRSRAGDHAERLELLESKIKALMPQEGAGRLETDLEALMEADGQIYRPGPRVMIKPEIIHDLREAILACRVIEISYRARNSGKVSRQEIHPYGLLYGNRPYLVGWNTWQEDYRLYSISNIEELQILPEYFEREAFSLAEYAENSFGVFQEEPRDVVLRFSPEVAAEASEYLFHPSQEKEPQGDGSLIVRLHCGGMLELSWHLFSWGTGVEVLEPSDLRRKMEAVRKALIKEGE